MRRSWTVAGYPRLSTASDGVLLGQQEMALVAGVPPGTVRKWFMRGLLPPVDGPLVGGRVTVSGRMFDVWLSERPARGMVPGAVSRLVAAGVLPDPRGRGVRSFSVDGYPAFPALELSVWLGPLEVAAVLGLPRRSAMQLWEGGWLPPLDGPSVNGRPTVSRGLLLASAWSSGWELLGARPDLAGEGRLAAEGLWSAQPGALVPARDLPPETLAALGLAAVGAR